MVSRMMRWRPWPPLAVKKFQVRLVVRRAEGVRVEQEAGRATAEVRWKGPKAALGSLRRTLKRNCTREGQVVRGDEEGVVGAVEWNEEFESVLTLTSPRENAFHPWELAFVVLNGPQSKASVIGTASLNVAEYTSAAEEEVEIILPLSLPGVTTEHPPSLHLILSLLELKVPQEALELTQRPVAPVPLSPSSGDSFHSEKDELSVIKAGLRKVKFFTDLVSTRKSKKTCQDGEGSDDKCSSQSEGAEYTCPCDTGSLDDLNDGEPEDAGGDSGVRKSFSYGTLASAYSSVRIDGQSEDWIYYSHRRSDVGYSHAEELTSSAAELPALPPSKRSLLPWKKRKLSFWSLKAKGEPLLKKAYGEEGGDDIDYDRRVLDSSGESLSAKRQKDQSGSLSELSASEFGDDNFVIGSWESKELVSRDGNMKLSTRVFFASIDQRCERAAGESACTALVAVIADWFQTNRDAMPVRSQFDGLIRDGSLEWRKLCENQIYREQFPDKHFDLETVLHARIRPLSVDAGKSFIGFFHPEGTEENTGFDFLHGAMSFDGIWDEIRQSSLDRENPRLYIVSWNDHFFVLKIEGNAYYIIDTLGERLYEDCRQAYILKFDENTSISRIPGDAKTKSNNSDTVENAGTVQDSENSSEEDELVIKGKESCKEYIKSFLAAIPIRELQADIKKGLVASSTPLHHRLQIEFHYTDVSEDSNPATMFELEWPGDLAAEATTFNPTPAVAVV